MFKIAKFFFITIILSYFAVWISDRPGKVRIVWQEYLIETNVVGLSTVFFLILLGVILFLLLVSKIKNIPEKVSFSQKEKYLALGNESLDDLAINLFLGDKEALEKNSRKIKKYLKNEMFSTVMLFNTALSNNNLDDAQKYLKILKTIPKADYISRRADVMLALKENNIDTALSLLLEHRKEYENDTWISEKLAILYSQNKEWELGWESIKRIKAANNTLLSSLQANLHALSGKNIFDSIKISENSFHVLIEAVKQFIKNNEISKAAKLIEKHWFNFNCTEIIETFIKFGLKNNADSLKRHKLIVKVMKKHLNSSDEVRLSLAMSAFQAKIWGESQKYLDDIPRSNWDERTKNLYEEICKKSEKLSMPSDLNDVNASPEWYCISCKTRHKQWQFICDECKAVNSLKWPKTSDIKKKKFFLENPFRHFPKM